MNDEHRKIIISRIYRQTGPLPNEPISPLQRWLFYLALIPVLIGLLILGVFFFSIFLALFVIIVAGIGIRFWWLRHKLQNSTRFDEQEKRVDIEDAEIIETRTNKPGHR
ncbi:hypothetical protein [Nitrosomonas communis]|uniref:hypothetical protein n=1 Tax=Nitrosomonas communis TaxID=44574 RepID=UPI0026F12BF2|nr:hypothetical protein [Nitrosomonas communis]MCO6429058.1 hypothetical protein [Nitrosomonas communis]